MGYAVVFYRDGDPTTQYQIWPGAVERIMPTAVDEALKRGDDVRALFNHDPSLILGRTKAETLGLAVDQIGLRYEITPADTSTYRDLVRRLQRGDVDGSSFSFGVEREEWRVEDGIEVRERAIGDTHRENGLLARFLLTCPPGKAKRWTEASPDEAMSAGYRRLVRGLLGLDRVLDDSGRIGPRFIGLSRPAQLA